ncbi:zinc-binding dehydrogenase [Streptomyces sp. NBC_00005]
MVEPSPSRRAAAERHGARVLDPRAVDVVDEVMAHTRGRGVDAAVECAGRPEALDAAICSMAAQAPVVMVALYSGPVAIGASAVRLAEMALLGAEAYPDGVFERHDVRDARRLKVLVDIPGNPTG